MNREKELFSKTIKPTILSQRRLAFIWLVIFVALCAVTYFTRDKKLVIDLPEEISQAKAGDTLIILYLSEDSLSLGFKNY